MLVTVDVGDRFTELDQIYPGAMLCRHIIDSWIHSLNRIRWATSSQCKVKKGWFAFDVRSLSRPTFILFTVTLTRDCINCREQTEQIQKLKNWHLAAEQPLSVTHNRRRCKIVANDLHRMHFISPSLINNKPNGNNNKYECIMDQEL